MPSENSSHRVFNFPGWQDNAYVQLLQAKVAEEGWELTRQASFLDAVRELTSPERDGVVHIQWPTPVTEEAESEKDAFRRADIFADAVYSATQLNRPVLWTVHNVLPHDARYPRPARKLHAALARVADVVHVLTPHTAELAREAYDIDPAKIVEIPHSSYAGVYGEPVAQDVARERLGVEPGGAAVLSFGWIRPYKGLEHLSQAVDLAVSHGADLRVLLAGRPLGDVDDIVSAIEEGPAPVTSHLSRVDDEDVPVWFGAADVVVLPYRNVLNSGTMHLAATYGVPVILPDEPHLVADLGDEAWIRFFDRDDPAASIARLLEDDWFSAPEAAERARAFAAARAPEKMADRYAQLLERLLAERHAR